MERRSRKRPRRYVETSAFLRGVARLLSAAGARVGQGDVEEFQQLLQLRTLVDRALVEAVAGLRDSGVTWEQIGQVSGTTRQGALLYWNPRLAERATTEEAV